MRTNPNWTPLLDRDTERRRRSRILGLSALAFVIGGAMMVASVVAVIGLGALTELPEGYTDSDVCWVEEGEQPEDGGLNVLEVLCWEDHDYVSGETAASEEDCPLTSVGYLYNEDGGTICLERPR